VKHRAGREIDEAKSQVGRPLEATQDMRAMLRVVGVGARIAIHESVFQGCKN